MSAKNSRDALAARAAQVSQRPARQNTTPRSGGGAGAPRTDPVRVTSALEPQTYRVLKEFCQDTETALDVARVPHAVVIRALIDRLATDPGLRESITEDIARILSDQ